MEKSLFIPLRNEGLTTMKIRYDFKTGAVKLYAAKEWEKDHDFAGYNHSWGIDGIWWSVVAAEAMAVAVSAVLLAVKQNRYGYFA